MSSHIQMIASGCYAVDLGALAATQLARALHEHAAMPMATLEPLSRPQLIGLARDYLLSHVPQVGATFVATLNLPAEPMPAAPASAA